MSTDTILDILKIIGVIAVLFWISSTCVVLVRTARIGGAAPGQRKRLLIIGVSLFVIGSIIQAVSNTSDVAQIIGRDHIPLITALSFFLVLAGAGTIAMAKGRNIAWGLLGLLSCIGITLILCLHDYDIPVINTTSDDNPNNAISN